MTEQMPMTEDDLLRWLTAEQQQALRDTDESGNSRTQAMRAYMREPYGNEEEGRSKVVASDVFDAIEGMIPDLIEPFTASDKAVVFDPVGPEDEEAAEQVTNACNHVFYKQNNGFLILYAAAKDALQLRTGGVKWYWEVKRTPSFSTRQNVPEMQLAAYLAANPNAMVVEQTDAEPTPEIIAQFEQRGEQVPRLLTVKIKVVESKGKVRIMAIPPEELRVSARHNSILLDTCPYVAHVTLKSLSDLRQMGYDVDETDVRAASTEDTYIDQQFRDTGARQYGNARSDNSGQTDPASLTGWVREEYVLVDFDGDGITERRKVVRLGMKVLENVEFSHVPIAAWTPYILTHRFTGMSVTDLVEDFQRIRTEIWRAQMDNLSLANNQESVVLTDSQGSPMADIDDLLNRRPGGILREKVAGAIRPYNQRWQGIEAMPMIELLETAKENRTGWTRYSQGLDGDSLNKTATGTRAIMNASQKRIKIMARVMAEALVAPMFRGVFKTLSDYCMEKLAFRLNGNFVTYDPQEWRDGYDMTINVGIGTGDVQQQNQFLTLISQAQFAAMNSPMNALVDAQSFYNVQSRLAENAGFKNPGEFWVDPSSVQPQPPPQPPPDPKIVVTQMQLDADGQKFQATLAADQQKAQMDAQLQMRVDMNRQEYEARQKQLELEQQAQLATLKEQYADARAARDIELAKYKADLEAQTRLIIADKTADPAREAAAQQNATLQEIKTHLLAPLELMRNPATGQVDAIKRGGMIRPINRGPDGRVIGVQ